MALRGTIQDFGISDIFQLIGQQRKTGILILSDGSDKVRVHFRSGAVVRAESSGRPKHMQLGSMLLNAGVITQEQLDEVLKVQGRTLQRIGALIEMRGWATRPTIAEFATLQITETVYRLFLWSEGTYEFEQANVEPPLDGVEPLGAEHILMEGMRMIDEWPRLRPQLPPYSTVYECAKPLPVAAGSEIGKIERRVYELVGSGRDLQSIIHRSRVGEFDACRAVLTLFNNGFIRVGQAKNAERASNSKMGFLRHVHPIQVLGRAAVYIALIVLAVVLLRGFDGSWYGINWNGLVRATPTVAHGYLAKAQIRIIGRALEVYRFNLGQYPEDLGELVKQGILQERDLRYPFEERYYYRATGGRVELLPPLR